MSKTVEPTPHQKFKQASRNYILTFVLFSLGYIVLGALLITAPNTSQKVICYMLGIVAIVLGIVRITSHFLQKDVERIFRSDIPVGIMLILAGVYLLVQGDALWEMLPVLLGFAIVFDSVLKMQHAFDLKLIGFTAWWLGMAASIITAILGMLLVLGVFSGAILFMYWGITLLIDGIMNLVIITLVVIQTKKVKKKATAVVNNVKSAISDAANAPEEVEIVTTELPTFDDELEEDDAAPAQANSKEDNN